MRLNILLVEDDLDFSQMVADLDIGLPDTDGHALARSLRDSLPGKTPIVVLTGQRNARLTEAMDLLLHKPIPVEQFGALLKYVHLLRDKHRCI